MYAVSRWLSRRFWFWLWGPDAPVALRHAGRRRCDRHRDVLDLDRGGHWRSQRSAVGRLGRPTAGRGLPRPGLEARHLAALRVGAARTGVLVPADLLVRTRSLSRLGTEEVPGGLLRLHRYD